MAILTVAAYQGLRVAEIVGLDRGDVDFRAGILFVRHGKGAKDRELPLHAVAAKALEAYLETRAGDEHPAVFVSRRMERLSTCQVRRLTTAIAREAKIPKRVHPHALRHTFATLMIEAGADLQTVQELLGHESIETTTIYTYVSQERKRRAMEDLD